MNAWQAIAWAMLYCLSILSSYIMMATASAVCTNFNSSHLAIVYYASSIYCAQLISSAGKTPAIYFPIRWRVKTSSILGYFSLFYSSAGENLCHWRVNLPRFSFRGGQESLPTVDPLVFHSCIRCPRALPYPGLP